MLKSDCRRLERTLCSRDVEADQGSKGIIVHRSVDISDLDQSGLSGIGPVGLYAN